MGKTKRKRTASYKLRRTKNRRNAKRELKKRACESKVPAQLPVTQRPSSPIVAEITQKGSTSTSSSQVDAKGESSCFLEEQTKGAEDRECTDCFGKNSVKLL